MPGSLPPQRPYNRWLPRTLLWQTFLLIALLLSFALAAWAQIFRYFEEPTRARDLAQMVVSVVNLTRTAMYNVDLNRRTELLIQLAALEDIHLYPAEPSDEIEPISNDRPMRLLVEEVKQRLGEDTRIASKWKTLEGFWVSFNLVNEGGEKEKYWVMLPQDRLKKTGALTWLVWGSAALAVSLLGAYLIASRIGNPLRELARAARVIGNGQTPQRQKENGPYELAIVAHAFNQMAGDLARTDADRALILAGVSHDLRTPLARLRLGIELSCPPDDETEAMVADIEEMNRIIGQFLDFGRGTPQEPIEAVDIAELARNLVEPYQRRGTPLTLDAPAPVMAAIYTLPIRRALANLIDNALRYAGNEKTLDVSVYQNDDEVMLEVADRGPGIPPQDVERLRRPFTRLESARSNTKGAGLGLAIVEQVVKAHEGRLDLLPREGGGLRAVIALPLAGPSFLLMPATSS